MSSKKGIMTSNVRGYRPYEKGFWAEIGNRQLYVLGKTKKGESR